MRPAVRTRVCARAQRGAWGAAAPPPRSPPGRRRRASPEPFTAGRPGLASPGAAGAGAGAGGGGVVNLAPGGEVAGSGPEAGGSGAAHRASLRPPSRPRCAETRRPGLPAPSRELLSSSRRRGARLGPLKRRRANRLSHKQVRKQAGANPPPFVLPDLPGKPFLHSPSQPQPARGPSSPPPPPGPGSEHQGGAEPAHRPKGVPVNARETSRDPHRLEVNCHGYSSVCPVVLFPWVP
ncbi:basic proline-rich protein-like [Meriones unguiculatus]|uniref:basic proline-rich protein-like n=1 Tax=Meriones unguiculatus TaxID=10047 RepID=UPI00293F7496|nr:basic proline-rich protein-like [Meriones unguiculatus]